MPHRSTADIIPFPMHRMEQVGRDRLARSLARLQGAAAEQERAVAAWRAQLGELRHRIDALQLSFRAYRARLDAAGSRTLGVNAEARRLETWADGALASLSQDRPR